MIEKNNRSYYPLVCAFVYVLLSLFVAYVTFGLLSSSGSFSGKGYTLGGAATGFFLTFSLLLRFHRQYLRAGGRPDTGTGGVYQIRHMEEYKKQYISQIVIAITEATLSIKLHFPMLRTSAMGEIPKMVNDAIKNFSKKVPVTLITCAEYDRIAPAYELNNLENVTVLFSPDLQLSDLRFTLIDDDDVVVGINPEQHEYDEYHPSSEWVRLRSVKLARILSQYFDELGNHSQSYDQYVRQTIDQYTEGAEGDPANYRLVSKSLRLPEAEILRVLGTN